MVYVGCYAKQMINAQPIFYADKIIVCARTEGNLAIIAMTRCLVTQPCLASKLYMAIAVHIPAVLPLGNRAIHVAAKNLSVYLDHRATASVRDWEYV